jgi:putative flippase GtrA
MIRLTTSEIMKNSLVLLMQYSKGYGLLMSAKFRFLLGGGVNTGITYVLYCLLTTVISYRFAYGISYVVGILFSYCFNSVVVFKVNMSLKKLLLYPLVYVVQGAMLLVGLWVLVDVFCLSKFIAPVLLIGVSVPLNYLLSRRVLTR